MCYFATEVVNFVESNDVGGADIVGIKGIDFVVAVIVNSVHFWYPFLFLSDYSIAYYHAFVNKKKVF